MKQVIRINEVEKPKKISKKESKPIELTHLFNTELGWVKTDMDSLINEEITYLGKCELDGDMFMSTEKYGRYKHPIIRIYKGQLNDGVY